MPHMCLPMGSLFIFRPSPPPPPSCAGVHGKCPLARAIKPWPWPPPQPVSPSGSHPDAHLPSPLICSTSCPFPVPTATLTSGWGQGVLLQEPSHPPPASAFPSSHLLFSWRKDHSRCKPCHVETSLLCFQDKVQILADRRLPLPREEAVSSP